MPQAFSYFLLALLAFSGVSFSCPVPFPDQIFVWRGTELAWVGTVPGPKNSKGPWYSKGGSIPGIQRVGASLVKRIARVGQVCVSLAKRIASLEHAMMPKFRPIGSPRFPEQKGRSSLQRVESRRFRSPGVLAVVRFAFRWSKE